MITTDNYKEGICSCGHRQSDHNPQEYPELGVGVPGHGPCSRANCECKKFTWVAWWGTPEARRLIRKIAEKQALSEINRVAKGFGYTR